MPAPDWNQHYLDGSPPWHTDTPSPELVAFMGDRRPVPGRALDIGCGTGLHARWLAAHGFDVVGVDIAPAAIERASATATPAAGTVRYAVLDFLETLPDGGPFDLVFDRGVFHVFDAADDRARFASQVARCLAPNGHWLSLIGSTDGPPREEGPPRRSARDITTAIEPVLELVELRATQFDLDRPVQPRAWCCVARPREAHDTTGATPAP